MCVLTDKMDKGWITLIIVTLSIFTIVIDKTFMNVAISSLIHDLHTTIGTVQIIIATYSLTMASLMLVGGRIQNILGRKRTFLTGASIYGVGTIVAALSINSTMLLLGWSIMEGVGAALMMPATTSIISGTYEGEKRAFALGITSSMASGAGTVGPIIGGFLTTFYSWRYAFGLELIVIMVIIIFSGEISVFPPDMDWSQLNIVGAVNSTVGIFLFVLGILVLNNPNNWLLSFILISFGILLLIIFYLNQRSRINKNQTPLVDVTLFKYMGFTLANITRFIMNFTIGGVLFIIPVYVQSDLGANPLTTGLTLIPMSVAIFVMSSMAGKLSKIIQPRYILAIGALAAISGSVYLTLIFNPYTTIVDMVPGIFMLGVGMGIVFPHSANEIFFAAKKEQQPDASGIMNTGINLGSSLGTAILGLILILGGFSSVGLAANTGQSTGVQDNILGVHELVGKFEHQSYPTEKNIPVDIQKVNTMKTAFNLITIVLLVSLIISLFIPRHKTKKEQGGCVSSNI
ncbi:MFS transporter [Methanobacterium lacus]|uniref:MFS transporter n=1 Tax=Methanobacterium lacus (strain AL-21) TaxID=877455 RepID=UPI00373AE760